MSLRILNELSDFLKMRGFPVPSRLPAAAGPPPPPVARARSPAPGAKYRVDVRATPHSLRHSWASQLARAGSLHAVQQMAGHKTLTSTEIYLHTQPHELMAAVESLPGYSNV